MMARLWRWLVDGGPPAPAVDPVPARELLAERRRAAALDARYRAGRWLV